MTTKIPLPYTQLSLPYYAEIMGINPIQFMSANAPTVFPSTGCTDRWLTYSWQGGERVSRYELAVEIAKAEREIMSELGYYLIPRWTEDEEHPWPHFYDNRRWSLGGLTPSYRLKSIPLRQNRYIQGGVKTTALVGTPTTAGADLVYTDEDSDGIIDTATITIATTVTDTKELRIFYAGYEGDERWEIRPVRSKSIAGGTATVVVDAWLMFDLDKLTDFPGSDGYDWLGLTDESDLMTSVDVYRVYNDDSDIATLYWERHPSFAGVDTETTHLTQSGYLNQRIASEGLVTVRPGTYSSGAWTTANSFEGGREPDYVRISYQSGLREQTDNGGDWVIPEDLAVAVAYMATARVARPLCTKCQNVRALEERLRNDLSIMQRGETGTIKWVNKKVVDNPFGSLAGEVEAWGVVQSRLKEYGSGNATVALM